MFFLTKSQALIYCGEFSGLFNLSEHQLIQPLTNPFVIGLFLKKGSEGNQYNDLFSSGKRPNIDFHRSFNEEKVNSIWQNMAVAIHGGLD